MRPDPVLPARPTRRRRPLAALGVAAVAAAAAIVPAGGARAAETEDPVLPVLLVIANTDFSYEEYAAARRALEERGIACRVAGPDRTRAAVSADGARMVALDVDLREVRASDYRGLFVAGGRGAAGLQHAFPGTYLDPGYELDPSIPEALSGLVGDLVREGKPVAASHHGVTVLAWARVDGVSPLAGGPHVKVFSGSAGSPAFVLDRLLVRADERDIGWHLEQNGALTLEEWERAGGSSSGSSGGDHDVIDDDAGDLLPPPRPASAGADSTPTSTSSTEPVSAGDKDDDILYDPGDDLPPPARPVGAARGPVLTGDDAGAVARDLADAILAR